jgi:transcriptional regulator with XRE-family HTH domain
MKTKSKTIAQMAATLAEDPKVEQEVRDEIARNYMVSHLLSLRVSKGLTQEQIAQSMECDSSKVSRLESGNDENLRWPDIIGYAGALNVNLCVIIEDPTLPAAEQIKRCVYKISEHLKDLAELARKVGGDDDIAKKIHEFSGEVLLNFLLRYKDHNEDLRSFMKLTPPLRTAIEVPKVPIQGSERVVSRENVPA